MQVALDGIVAAGGSATCIRAVADVHGHEVLTDLVAAARDLDAEREALDTIRSQDTTLRYVASHGTAADKKKVVTALRNLLTDPIGRKLSERVDKWLKTSKEVFNRLLQQAPKPTGGDGAPPPEGAIQQHREAVTRSKVAKAVRDLAGAALKESDAGSFDVTVVLTPRTDK